MAEQVSPQPAVVLPGGDRGIAQLIRILQYMTSWIILCLHFLLPSFPVVSTTQHKINARSLAKMQWVTLAVATLFAQNVAAQQMLRFACSQLVVERTDPLVNPGIKFTPHLHQIVGGNSFNVSMDPSNDPAQLSTCTSCSFPQDKSNYWTAVMFFKHKNGSYIRVPQVGNGGPQGKLLQNGGLDIYYLQNGNKMTAFKKVGWRG